VGREDVKTWDGVEKNEMKRFGRERRNAAATVLEGGQQESLCTIRTLKRGGMISTKDGADRPDDVRTKRVLKNRKREGRGRKSGAGTQKGRIKKISTGWLKNGRTQAGGHTFGR